MATRIDIPELEKAMDGLLESALVPERWAGTLEAISRATGSVGAHIMPAAGKFSPGFLTTPNLLEPFDVYFAEDWYKRDFRERGISVALAKGIVIEHDIASEDEFRRQEFYTEFLARFGLRYSVMIGFTSGDTLLSLNLQRRVDDHPFDREEERILLAMRSKLTASAEIIRSLQAAKIESMSEAFELSGTASVFFDRTGRVSHLNSRAERLLDGDIRIVDRELTSASQEETGLLRRHLKAVSAATPSSVLPCRRRCCSHAPARHRSSFVPSSCEACRRISSPIRTLLQSLPTFPNAQERTAIFCGGSSP
ncbi:hypothetical protein [Rhizobium laguerreae]|uniref:PAS domain-containing protein n=1 Tax=Rhizobium laguerreae TaxID=1076926 RepID=A0ABR6GGA7_9HYPH|nr:hypothetical protein [Rhizobium laguerreae]MBB3164930.1 PAS domain-containing protein [Rhizobium laguerreae]UFW63563.1 hypothetical protein RlegWSM1455_18825 [Rhizobium laguerreae]